MLCVCVGGGGGGEGCVGEVMKAFLLSKHFAVNTHVHSCALMLNKTVQNHEKDMKRKLML